MEGERWMEGDGMSMRRFIWKERDKQGEADGKRVRNEGGREKERGIEREAKCSEQCVCVYTLKWLILYRTLWDVRIASHTHTVVALILDDMCTWHTNIGIARKYSEIKTNWSV